MKFVENEHTRLLGNAMDAYTLRQRMTTTNIANMDNPEYNRVGVSFEEELQDAEGRNLDQINAEVVEHEQRPVMEDEMMEMADTQIRVQLVTRSLRHNFNMLRSSITGRAH